MIVVLDASVLVYLLDEQASAPIDPATGAPVTYCKLRVAHLIATLADAEAKIVIPTPALGEVLVKAQAAGPDWLRILKRSRHFRIVGLDERAAVEYAARQATRQARPRGVTRAKAKFDDQIIAIATVEHAEIIYSDDPDIARSVSEDVRVIGIASLPIPAQDIQPSLPFDAVEPEAEDATDEKP